VQTLLFHVAEYGYQLPIHLLSSYLAAYELLSSQLSCLTALVTPLAFMAMSVSPE
jgi:hypothetical protein